MGTIKREPGIHINRQNFEIILDSLIDRGLIKVTYNYKNPKDTVLDEFFRLATLQPLNNRSVNVSNKKVESRVSRVLETSKEDSLLFSRTLTLVRQSKKHRGITLITQASKEWATLQLITKNATDFCNENGLDLQTGYTKYIQLGFQRMTSYSILKFPNLHESICQAYAATEEINSDPNTDITTRLVSRYSQVIYSKTQLRLDYLEYPEKKVCFVRAATICKSLGASPEDFIDAQFEALAFVDGIRDPAQICGPKAKERLTKFLFENNRQVRKPETTVDFGKIKKLRDDTHRSKQ